MKRRLRHIFIALSLLYAAFVWSGHHHFGPDHDEDNCPLCVLHAFSSGTLDETAAFEVAVLPPIAVTLQLDAPACKPSRLNPNAPATAPPLA